MRGGFVFRTRFGLRFEASSIKVWVKESSEIVHTLAGRALLDKSRMGEHGTACALLRRLSGDTRRAVRDMEVVVRKEGSVLRWACTFENEEDTPG